MLPYPEIDPVAVALGPLKIHWYGLAYLAGIAAGWWLALRRCSQPWSPVQREQVDDLVFYVALGVVLGGRIGYILLYDLGHVVADPISAVRFWEGGISGMSSHGGFAGAILLTLWYARKHGYSFWNLIDNLAVTGELVRRLTAPDTGIILDAWLDADGNPHGQAGTILTGG